MSTPKKSKLKENMFTLVLLTISGAMIYALPYFRNYYYDVFVQCFNLTNTQMGSLGSVFGALSVVAYFFGGVLADRFSARKLITLSLTATGLLGFILLLYPPYPVVLAVHALWGITSILTFWCALVKAIRSIADSDEQGKAFGFMEGGRGITNIVHFSLILAMFSYLSSNFSDKLGLSAIIFVYSAVCVLLGIIVFFNLKETDPELETATGQDTEEKKPLFNVPVLKKVLKMPHTWLVIIMMFTSYATLIGYYYIAPYTTSVFGASVVLAAAFTIFSQYCRPIGCFVAGIMGDKVGSSKVMLVGFAVMILGILGIIFTPGKASLVYVVVVFACAIYTSMYAIQALHYAILEEGDYPTEFTGTAVAIIAPLGYSSEVFVPIVAGYLLDHFSGALGYQLFFGILATLGCIGLIATPIWCTLFSYWHRITGNRRRAVFPD
jgi:MFS family permease